MEPPRVALDTVRPTVVTRRIDSARAPGSTSAAPSDLAVAALPETDVGLAGERRTGRHPWLRANGDSATGGAQPVNAIQADAREVFGHISRTRQFIEARQPAKALPELRMAAEEYFAVASTRPGARETAMMRQQLSSVAQLAYATCRESADSVARSAPRTTVCEGLARMAARIAQSGDGRPLPPGGRRNQRQPIRPQPR